MNLPLVRRARQEAREAGLAGKDPVSRLLDTLLTITAAMAVRPQFQASRRDHLALAIIGGLFVAAMAGGFVGYRYGRYAVVAECSQRVFPTSQGTACIMWPISR